MSYVVLGEKKRRESNLKTKVSIVLAAEAPTVWWSCDVTDQMRQRLDNIFSKLKPFTYHTQYNARR